MIKKYFFSLLCLLSLSVFAQQNVEFEKSNFPDKKDQFKEARRNFEDGKKLFIEGRAERDDFVQNNFLKTYGYLPVSDHEFENYGEAQILQALPLLQKANDFNPNNAELNYLIGYSLFITKPQQDGCLKFLEMAYKLKPDVSPDLPYFLGWANHIHYKWDEAIKNYGFYKNYLGSAGKGTPAQLEDVQKKIEECNVGKKLMAAPERVFIDNLGGAVNSSFPDYSALITADESMMIFTSRRNTSTGGKLVPGTDSYFEDLYVTYKKNGEWTPAANLGPPINSDENDATSGLSPDGTTLYIYEFSMKDGGDVYESHLIGNAWTKPEHMNKNINSKSHESTVSESSDNKNLYVISDKEGGLGNRDVWMSTRDEKGKWAAMTNAGPAINTKYGEEGVFMHPDGRTMYFSSRGHKTMGGYDIFKSVFENGKWSEPQNLGYPINSPEDDVFFVISGSGRRGYYASAKDGGYGEKDLYMITFLGPEKPPALSNEDNLIASVAQPVKSIQAAPPMEIKQASLTILKGTITDALTQKIVEASIELIDNTKNEVIATFKSNSSTGKYLVSLPSGKNYGIAVKAEGYLFHSENFDIPLSSGYQEVIKDVQLKNVAVGSKIILKNIFFDTDKATLRPESTNELERLTKLLNDVPSLKIEISGHTDSRGSDDHNLKLSQARAQSVVDYLIGKGISKDRLKAAGYGETKPIAANDTEENLQLNRRTEFEILSK